MKLPFLSVNHLEHKIEDLYYNNSFGFIINYLKQAIDISYSMQMAQDVRLLKICNFCEKAFIANNPKAEYDTPQCKNKANVYKSRGKTISRNVIQTEDGIIAKVIFDEDNLLYDKSVAITGTLEKLSRKEAMQIIADLGGHCQDGVNKETNYLILGNNDYNPILRGKKSSKLLKAESLKLKGQDIDILSENVFYDVIFTKESENLLVNGV